MCAHPGRAAATAGCLDQVAHKANTAALGGTVCPAPGRPALDVLSAGGQAGAGPGEGGRLTPHSPDRQHLTGRGNLSPLGSPGKQNLRVAVAVATGWFEGETQDGAHVQQWAAVCGARGCPSSRCPRDASSESRGEPSQVCTAHPPAPVICTAVIEISRQLLLGEQTGGRQRCPDRPSRQMAGEMAPPALRLQTETAGPWRGATSGRGSHGTRP